ncbi:hypothetical protein EW146_g6022 [Bondarzewia mesenterica]|uniref:Proteophosphoglycan ppg4 n=1 Tax=Bondarzewia mesenterica TaxID=1095465 RepID=A0A4V3XEN6_9AGAM|nr:hypothetical protein EW146_g6022 [Bondarzewia mesenterica]
MSPSQYSPHIEQSANPTEDDSPTDPHHGDAHRVSHIASSPSPQQNSDEGYPSWLPKRPPPPAPTSTIQSSTFNMLANEAGPSEMGVWGGRKPTPRSVRIVSMQDSARRENTDQTRLSAGAPLAHSRIWSRATGAGVSPTVFSPTVDGPLQPSRPRFRSTGFNLRLLRDPSWKSRLHFFIFPLLVFAHVPLQTYFDFNTVFILIQIAKFPNPIAPGVPGSGRNWAFAAAVYIACWAFWIFGVFIGYELIYSFYRRWRFRRPLILPFYLSSPAFNLVSMTSYNHFCFMQHIRNSAFPYVNPDAKLPSSEASLRDALAETCYFYSQNLPTVAFLLPRAGLSLVLLLSFFSPEQLPGGLTLGDVDQSIGRRDGTYFNQENGTLSGYAKGVLIANAAWTAWRILVLLLSWVGIWVFSGYGCAGICGPRNRWEEEDADKIRSVYSEKGSEAAGETLPWSWKECTYLRVQEAYEFCLTLQPPLRGTKREPSEPQEPFEGMEQVLAAVGLGGVPQPSRRGMLSQELFDSPNEGATRQSSPAQTSDVLSDIPKVEGQADEPGKNAPRMTLPYPFTGFGAKKEESDEEQIPFPPSPGPGHEASGESVAAEEEEEGEEEEYDITHGELSEGLEYVEEETEPRTSEEPSSFSGRASNSLSSLGQPVQSRYPFQFRHPGQRGSLSSAGSPHHSHRTPQSKSTSTHTRSTRNSRSTRSTGNDETSDSPMSLGTSSGFPSPVGATNVGSMPMPPRHPASTGQRRQRSGTVPIPTSPTPVIGPIVSLPRPRTQSPQMDADPEVLYESNGEGEVVGALDLGTPEGQASPEPEGEQEALEQEDSVGLLSHAPSPKTSFGGLRNRSGSVVSLTRRNDSRSRSGSEYRSRHNSSTSGSRNGSNSRHNSNSAGGSSVSVALGGRAAIRTRAQSLIQSVASASRSSVELVTGRRGRAQSVVRLEDYEDTDSSPYISEDALSNPESHTFGVPLIGGASAMRRAIERQQRQELLSLELSPDDEEKSEVEMEDALPSSASNSPPRLHEAPSIVSNVAPSERTLSMEPVRPSPFSQPGPSRSVVSPSGTQYLSAHEDLSTAAPSFVTAPATVEGTTESSGATPSSWGGLEHYMEGKDWKPV